MRAYSIITLVVVALAAGGLRVILGASPAEAVPSPQTSSLDIYQMQQNAKDLPALKFRDMTFVFAND